MAAYYFGNSPLNRHQSLEQTVERMIKELYEEHPEAEVIGAQIFLDGMGAHGFDILIGNRKLHVDYVSTSNENLAGWVRLVYGLGILESASVVNYEEAI